jgi:AmmeMemoRadiSam system protein A
MSLSDPATLSPPLRTQLLAVADEAIRTGLRGARLVVRAADFPEPLQVLRASFVTLHCDARLRGCIGNLEADRPLVEDIARNAYAAAFEDPRFPALAQAELSGLAVHLSILGVPEPMSFISEEDLIAQLRPGVDGLLLEDGHCRGTFLPSVWGQVSEPREFLRHLKHKAGLRPDYWSHTLTVKRYVVESVS